MKEDALSRRSLPSLTSAAVLTAPPVVVSTMR